MSALVITHADEVRLRELAYGIAKDIEDPNVLLQRLGFTHDDYEELATTRVWRAMLEQALSEWQGANNTHKRVKLKAAVNIEQAMPSMYMAMVNEKEPLAARVKVFEIMSRVGGLGNPEPAAVGAGSAFNLTIQLDGGREMVIGRASLGVTTQPEELAASYSPELDDDAPPVIASDSEATSEAWPPVMDQSDLLATAPFEELSAPESGGDLPP